MGKLFSDKANLQNKKQIWSVFFVLGYWSWSSLAFALEMDKTNMTEIMDEYSPEEAFNLTASRYKEKISETPSNVIIITKKQIQERGYTNLLQVLQDLPNIDIQRYASFDSAEQIGIRGIPKNNGFLVLQDGIRINSPTGEPIRINDNFPIHYAQQIEVVYGPTSVIYGADALTAVINIVSDKPENIDGVEVKGIAGEFNTYATQVKAGKRVSDNFSILAGGDYRESDNPNLSRYYPDSFVLNDLKTFSGKNVTKAQDRGGYQGDSQNYSAFAKLTFFKNLDIGMNYSFDKHRSDVSSKADYTDYGAKAYLNAELGTVYGNYKFSLTEDEKLKGFLRANYSWYELSPESRFVNKYDDFSGGYKYAFGERYQLEGQLEYHITDQHTVTGGFSLEHYYSIPKTTDLDAPYNPDQSPDNQNLFYPGTNNTLPVKIERFHYSNVAGYLQWNAHWHDMLSTSFAVRYDQNSRYGGTFNPKLGLVFRPTDKITSKFLYGSAFLAPAPYYAGQHFGSFSGKTGNTYTSSFFMIPNHQLKPEKIDTFELRADYRVNNNLNLGFSLYRNSLRGVISWAPTPMPVSDYIPGGFIKYSEHQSNIGKLKSYGGDVHFDYRYFFEDKSALKLWGNYSYLDGNLSRSDQDYGTDLPMVAKHKVKFGATYTYQNKYTITPKFYWVGRINSPQTEPDNPNVLQTTPAYWRVDLYTSAKIPEISNNFSLFLNVNNLFDKRYYNPGAFSASMTASPQDPRTISGGFVYKFGE